MVTKAGLPFEATAYLPPLAAEMAAFEERIRGADLTVPVTFSRKWCLADLVRHVCGIHRWAAEVVRKGTRASAAPKPPAGADLADWFRAGADSLLEALKNADPEAPCWNFGPGARVKAFWFRRQLHETMVHRCDADLATGVTPAVSNLLAADGVDEALRVMMPFGQRWAAKPKPRLSGPLLVRTVDTGHGWLLTPGDEVMPEARVAGVRQAGWASRVSGRADVVLLMLWGRVGVDGPDIVLEGERETTVAFLRSRITP